MKVSIRIKSLITRLTLVLSIFFLSFSFAQNGTTPNSADNNSPKEGKRLWNLKNVDIQTVIDQLSKETGKNFVVSPRVAGKVTFISSYPLTKDELYQAFLALLETSGFEAIPSGPIVKIVPEAYAKEEAPQVFNADKGQETAGMAVTVERVKYVSATELVKVLKQLVFHFGYVESYAPTNDIIISDRSSNITQLLNLIRRLDKPTASSIEVIHLKYADSASIVKMVTTLLAQRGDTSAGMIMVADDRINDVMLRGGTPEQHLQVRSLISELDAPQNRKSIRTDVIYLKYLRAQKVAVILNGLIKNYIQEKAGQTSTTTTTSSGEGTEETKAPALVNYSSQLNQLASNSQNGAPATGSGSNTPVDFSNMTDKQPKSGSISQAIQWEESTNSVIISAPEGLLVKLKQVIRQLDIRRQQVLIEAVIAEVEADRANELGIELNTGGQVQLLTRFPTTLPLSGIGADNRMAISNPATADATGQGLSLGIFSGDRLRLLLRALEQDTRSNILSTPNIVTLDNEPAQIKVGQKISFSIGQIQNNPTGGNPFNFFNQQDVGLVLTINPQITSDGRIKLIIEQELSNVLPGQSSAGGNPNLSERFIHTTVMARNGDVFVLGGLIQNELQDVVSKVPFLGDIPGVGLLFRSHTKQLTKQNLMIFLRPTILHDDNTKDVVASKYERMRQQELDMDRPPFVLNNLSSPALPVNNKEDAALPKPFVHQEIYKD